MKHADREFEPMKMALAYLDLMPRAIGEIAAERQRQIEKEGWSAKHDEQHSNGELARAAACYAMPQGFRDLSIYGANTIRTTVWPWDLLWWKPKDRRRDLVRAAALIVAEIERLDRSKLPKVQE